MFKTIVILIAGLGIWAGALNAGPRLNQQCVLNANRQFNKNIRACFQEGQSAECETRARKTRRSELKNCKIATQKKPGSN